MSFPRRGVASRPLLTVRAAKSLVLAARTTLTR
jgi:hypothetical protein